MKDKPRFILPDQIDLWKARPDKVWPDVVDDHFQIRLPYISDKARFAQLPPEYVINGVNAFECGIGGIVTPKSRYPIRRSIEQLARYFRREFGFDFCQFSARDDDNQYRAYFWISRQHRHYVGSGNVYPVIGACCFRHRQYAEPLPPGVPANGYFLQWIWFHPYERNQGHLTKGLPYFIARFGKFIAEGPFSPAMDRFLKKHHLWPYENAEQEAWFTS